MRYMIACMLLCLSAGYSQETADEAPVVTTEDGGEGQVAIDDSYINWNCGCNKSKGSKSK